MSSFIVTDTDGKQHIISIRNFPCVCDWSGSSLSGKPKPNTEIRFSCGKIVPVQDTVEEILETAQDAIDVISDRSSQTAKSLALFTVTDLNGKQYILSNGNFPSVTEYSYAVKRRSSLSGDWIKKYSSVNTEIMFESGKVVQARDTIAEILQKSKDATDRKLRESGEEVKGTALFTVTDLDGKKHILSIFNLPIITEYNDVQASNRSVWSSERQQKYANANSEIRFPSGKIVIVQETVYEINQKCQEATNSDDFVNQHEFSSEKIKGVPVFNSASSAPQPE